jgi:hypothetical protein
MIQRGESRNLPSEIESDGECCCGGDKMLLREEVQKRRHIEVRRNGNVVGIGASSSFPGNSVTAVAVSFSRFTGICFMEPPFLSIEIYVFRFFQIFFIFFNRFLLNFEQTFIMF